MRTELARHNDQEMADLGGHDSYSDSAIITETCDAEVDETVKFLRTVTASIKPIELLDRAWSRGEKVTYFNVQKDPITLAIWQDAYELTLWLVANGEAAQKALLQHPILESRKRLPSLNNIPRLALIIVSGAKTPAQLTQCTEDAYVLEHAILHNLHPPEFTSHAERLTRLECKHFVRTRRRARRSAVKGNPRSTKNSCFKIAVSAAEMEAMIQGGATLEVHLGRPNDAGASHSLSITHRKIVIAKN